MLIDELLLQMPYQFIVSESKDDYFELTAKPGIEAEQKDDLSRNKWGLSPFFPCRRLIPAAMKREEGAFGRPFFVPGHLGAPSRLG